MNPNGRPPADLKTRLLSKIKAEEGADGCWIWQGNISKTGYGQMFFGKKGKAAHRISYSLFVGPVGDGQHVHHRCRNRACVRPDHLEVLAPDEHARETKGFEQVHEQWRQRTHCKHGHPLSGDNIAPGKGNERICLTCQRERQHRYYLERKAANPGPGRGSQWAAKTHCPKGHEYSPGNTKINSKGSRVCKTCQREYARLRMARIRAIDPTYGRRKE